MLCNKNIEIYNYNYNKLIKIDRDQINIKEK
jgi:hypothetical protein